MAAALAVACGPDDAKRPDDCPTRPVASFRLLVTAPAGRTLPSDLLLTVRYGGGEEVYRLIDPPVADAVFCRPAVRDGGVVDVDPLEGGLGDASGGADAGPLPTDVEALSCKLWTNGAATVTVAGSNLERLEETLEAATDPKCGDLVTTDVVIELVSGDAGVR